jgi:hypothetical protein
MDCIFDAGTWFIFGFAAAHLLLWGYVVVRESLENT